MTTYPNETFSGCDITAAINFVDNVDKVYTKIIGTLQTVSYSINMDRAPVRSIGNVNAKDYVQGQRTIAGTLVFTVFNQHFAKEIIEEINKNYNGGSAFLVDELPPFNLIISAANEYGYKAKQIIYGIRLLNEGMVMSINDIYTENTYQFFATDVEYLNKEDIYVEASNNNLIFENRASQTKSKSNSKNLLKNTEYKKIDTSIILSTSVENPYERKKTSRYGLVNFLLNPKQYDGEIKISDIYNKNNYLIAVNSKSSLSLELPSGQYTAIYSNGSKKSNYASFFVLENQNKKNDGKILPIIEHLTDDSISLFCNNNHNVMKIIDENGTMSSKDIVNNKVTFQNLNENSRYGFFSAMKNSLEKSDILTTKTVNKTYMKDQIEMFINNNEKEFKHDFQDYKKMLNIVPGIYIIDELNKIKENREKQLKSNNDIEQMQNLKKDLEIIKDILNVAIRINNDFYNYTNRNSNNVKYTATFDEQGNNVIVSSNVDNIESSYFVNNKIKKDKIYSKDKFETDLNYCYLKNIAKSDKVGYCQAKLNNVKNNKIYFLGKNDEDKKSYINNNKQISQYLIDTCEKKINNEMYKSVSDKNIINCLYMYELKKNFNCVLYPPKVTNVDKENIYVTCDLYYIYNKDNYKNFYIVIGNYEDCKKNNSFYKYKINSNTKNYVIDRRSLGVHNDTSFSIWIENSKGEQISGAYVFFVGKDELKYEQEIYSYIYKNIIDYNNEINKNGLLQKFDFLFKYLDLEESNFLFDRKNLVFSLFDYVKNENDFIEILKNLKKIILPNLSCGDLIKRISINNKNLSIETIENCNYVVFDMLNKQCENINNFKNIKNRNVVFYAINKNCTKCSTLYYLNEKEVKRI